MRRRIVLLACAALALVVGVLSASAGGGNSHFAHLCQKNGWKTLARSDGSSFKNQGDCVSYGAHGGKLKQTISFTAPSSATVGDSDYTLTATATSGLPVTFIRGASSSGCSLSGEVVSFDAEGTCVIDANQAGNDVWAAADPVQQSITVYPTPSLVLDDSAVSTGWGSLSGSGLKPGATVYECDFSGCYSESFSPDASGNLSNSGPLFDCFDVAFPVYFTATTAAGNYIESNKVDDFSCPG